MKRGVNLLLMIFAVSFLLTGCNNESNILSGGNSGTKTCSKTTTDEDGYKTTDTMVITYKNDKVAKVENSNISEMDPDYVDFTLNIGQSLVETFNKFKGIEAACTKEDDNVVKMDLNVDFTKIDIDNIKETLGELYSEENAFYSKSDITVDDFISKNLDGYTCK